VLDRCSAAARGRTVIRRRRRRRQSSELPRARQRSNARLIHAQEARPARRYGAANRTTSARRLRKTGAGLKPLATRMPDHLPGNKPTVCAVRASRAAEERRRNANRRRRFLHRCALQRNGLLRCADVFVCAGIQRSSPLAPARCSERIWWSTEGRSAGGCSRQLIRLANRQSENRLNVS
jgi:predicted Zn-dependent protease